MQTAKVMKFNPWISSSKSYLEKPVIYDGIYHSGSASASMHPAKIMKFNFSFSLFCPDGCKYSFFHSTEFLFIYSSYSKNWITAFCRTWNIEQWIFLSYAPLEIFILKKLATLDISYFKAAEAIDSEPKRMEYFIVCAPWYLSLLY